MHNPAPVLENDTYTPMGLWHTHGSSNLGKKTRSYNNQQQQKKRIYKVVDFAIPADHRIKLKECEKNDKYLDLARELKKLWNMKETSVLIVIGAFVTITKGLLKDLEDLEVGGRVETDHLISTRRPDLLIIKKKNLQNCGLWCPGWPQSKVERKRKEGLVPGPC